MSASTVTVRYAGPLGTAYAGKATEFLGAWTGAGKVELDRDTDAVSSRSMGQALVRLGRICKPGVYVLYTDSEQFGAEQMAAITVEEVPAPTLRVKS